MIKNFEQSQKKHFRRVERSQFFWLTQNPYIFEKEKQILAEILKEKPKKILEVGCGEGANIVNLKKLGFNGELFGVDYSPAKITFAQSHAPFAKLRVANAYHLPFKSQKFDLVFCKNLLHHLQDENKTIREMARVCRPEGKVIIIEGNGHNLVNYIFGHLFENEKGMLGSTKEQLVNLVLTERSLELKEVLMKEPFNLYRGLLHYRYGFPIIGFLSKICLKTDKFFSNLIPQGQRAYIIIKTKKLRQPKRLENPKSAKEKAHFRQLFEKNQVLWWSTAAGKIRLSRRGQIAASFISPKDNVLEIGPGVGEFSQYLVRTRAKITGVEITPELVGQAQRKVRAKNISFCQGDIHDLPFAANTFNVVIGSSILHHLDLAKALPEIKRVLKTEGKIIFFEPNLANPQVFLQKKIGVLKRISRDSTEETAFFRWDLAASLEKVGFKNVQVKPFDFLHPFTPKILIKLVRNIEPILEKIPLLKEFSGSLFIYGEVNKPNINEIRKFWDENPLFSAEIREKLGSRQFFKKIDELKENEIDKFTTGLYRFFQAKGKKVLDAGCGPGYLTRSFARAGAKVTALDLSPVAVSLTKKSLDIFKLRAEVCEGNVEKLPFPNNNFDIVVSAGVIHHTPHPEIAIAEIGRVLKPGGRAIIGVYHLNFWLKPLIFPLTKAFLKILKVSPRGRKKLTNSSTVADFVRRYDGDANPLSLVLAQNEWAKLFKPYFQIEKIEPHFFPQRFFSKRKLPNILLKFLDHYFGTMVYFSLVKPGDKASLKVYSGGGAT